jgi:MFS transporter, putative metabolite:H+ symporter
VQQRVHDVRARTVRPHSHRGDGLVLAGLFAAVFATAQSEPMILAVGFVMFFCIQLAGNSMQIFASEVFPTNARASGFGFANSGGRIGAAIIVPGFLFIQTTWGFPWYLARSR